MAKLLIVLFVLALCSVSYASICLRYPLCYCSTISTFYAIISCENVTDLVPVQYLLTRFVRIHSLRIHGSELTDLPSMAFQGHFINVIGITARLVNLPDDALEGVSGLEIVNFRNCQFSTIPRAFSSATLKTVELVDGMLAGVEDQLQNNSQMARALLNNNRITHIYPTAFLNAASLLYLNLSSNLLIDLDPAVFNPVHQLKSIDLSNNRLVTVDGYFAALNPQELRLYGNNLTTVDSAFHSGMWSMKWLNLGGNPYLNVSSNTFNNTMPALTQLILSDNNLLDLDPYLLRNFQQLYILWLNGNHLSSIPRYFLSPTPKLKVLELADNDLTSVEDLFPTNQQSSSRSYLETVRLDGNQLKSIRFGASAKSILHLDLSRNQIHDILAHDLENLTYLYTLNLAGNPLVNLQPGCFKRLPHLKTLNLSSTNLKHLNHSVQDSANLKKLFIDNSLLTSIRDDEFFGVQSLRTFSVKNNSLVTVYGTMQNLINLTSLDVSNNNLTTLTSNSLPFINNTARQKSLWMADNPWSCDCRISWILEWLKVNGTDLEDEPTCRTPSHLQGKAIRSLNQTDLEFWQDNCPQVCTCKCVMNGPNIYTIVDCNGKNLDKLPGEFPSIAKEINLQNNNITSFDGFKADQLLELQTLNIENNSLSMADTDLPPSIKVLKLAGNNLPRFPMNKWSLIRFDLTTLSRNPWVCDCEAWNFREWLVKNKESVGDVQEVRCRDDGKLTNRIITELSKQDMCPTLQNTKIIVIVAVVILFIILCTCCCVFRKTLAVFCYSCGCRSLKENEKQQFTFDAFLLYADEDEDVALRDIAEGLESRIPGINLFIPTREVFMTSSINTESSLADCCKVIVLLTRGFLKNDQCMQLLKSSMACSIENTSRRMIFVIQDKNSLMDEVDITLRAIIKNSICLRFGEILFWQKLKYYLPKKNRS
ncbi:protein toll [Trichonephila clavata]|uniref:Protein toll n=1 Tax=Trichonephila clavata TaxID=2740835 RepID=A0A8X6ICJ8_TRICU|nr:protein toll [Trichonephila clavata]